MRTASLKNYLSAGSRRKSWGLAKSHKNAEKKWSYTYHSQFSNGHDTHVLAYINKTSPKSKVSRLKFENHRKSLIQFGQQSHQKLVKKAKNVPLWRSFDNRSILIGKKWWKMLKLKTQMRHFGWFSNTVRKCEQVIDQVENKERSHAFVLMHVTRIE